MPLTVSPPKCKIFLNKNSKYTEEQNIALSKTKNVKTPEQLITENMGFVYHLIDKEFSIYYRERGMSRNDLVSAGMMGLVVAASKSKYGTFLRYASFWIRYYVYREIRNDGLIKRPAAYCWKLNKIRKFQERYKYENGGKSPTMEWLSEKTGMSVEVVTGVLDLDENNRTTTISIDSMYNSDDDKKAIDRILADQYSYEGPSIAKEEIEDIMDSSLTEFEKTIVKMKYYSGYDNSEIASMVGTCTRNVRNAISKALKKMKSKIEER